MSKLLVVEGDPVDGTDTHNVTGSTTSSPPAPYTGTGDYAYKGEVSTGLSDFVTVGGIALAVVTSGSDLRSDGKTDHLALNGGSFTPSGADPSTLAFVPSTGVGPGTPNQAAGSSLLTVNGDKALLDGDAFDTCGVPGGEASSKVAAENQDFVTCSA